MTLQAVQERYESRCVRRVCVCIVSVCVCVCTNIRVMGKMPGNMKCC